MARALTGKVGNTFHIISSPRVSLDGDTATATAMWTVVASGDDGRVEVTMLGHHVDELVRVGDRWYFARRKGVMNVPSVYR
jgi:hypothetical protein